MKKSYLITTGVGVVLALLASLATTYYLLVPEIILFFGYGIAAYFLAKSFKEVSPWMICLIFICLQMFGQLIAGVIVPQFRLYMLINCIYFSLGTLSGLFFYKGKTGVKILTIALAIVFTWYYENATKANREFPAADMYEQLRESSMRGAGFQAD